MRARIHRPEPIIVRPQVDLIEDVLGDVSIEAGDRGTTLNLLGQVTYIRRRVHDGGGSPGKVIKHIADVTILKRDIEALGIAWTPRAGDLIQLSRVPDGLFVQEARPAFQQPSRMGSAPFDGWLLTIVDRSPTQRAANQYD
jgi:hypothetical protein